MQKKSTPVRDKSTLDPTYSLGIYPKQGRGTKPLPKTNTPKKLDEEFQLHMRVTLETQLEAYQEKRKNEGEAFPLLPMSHQKFTKLSAASKLYSALLLENDSIRLSSDEYRALKQGRLFHSACCTRTKKKWQFFQVQLLWIEKTSEMGTYNLRFKN